MLLLGMSSAVVKTSIRYNLSANAIASMNNYFNTVLFRIHFIYFKTTVILILNTWLGARASQLVIRCH